MDNDKKKQTKEMVNFSELRFFQQVIVHQRSRNTHCNPKWLHFLFNIRVHLAKKERKHKTRYSLQQQTRVAFKKINSRPFYSDFLKQESMVFSLWFQSVQENTKYLLASKSQSNFLFCRGL